MINDLGVYTPRHTCPAPCRQCGTEKPVARLHWDEYFMRLAWHASERSTCPQRSVGAVVVRDRMVLSTGYNGAPRGMPHCEDVGCNGGASDCERVPETTRCSRTVHAEANAIIQAARTGVAINDTVMYATARPCLCCFYLITNVGIRRVFFDGDYRDTRVIQLAKDAGVELIKMGDHAAE